MSYGCVVRKCKRNYANGLKVNVFSFSKDKELSDTCKRRVNFMLTIEYFPNIIGKEQIDVKI